MCLFLYHDDREGRSHILYPHHLLIDMVGLFSDLLLRIIFQYALSSSDSERGVECRIMQEFLNASDQFLYITFLKNQTGIVDDVWNFAGAGADDGCFGGHGLW